MQFLKKTDETLIQSNIEERPLFKSLLSHTLVAAFPKKSISFAFLITCSFWRFHLAKLSYFNFFKFSFKPYSGWAFSGLLTDGWSKKAPTLPKICHKYPAIMKLGTVIAYLMKIQKIHESHDTPIEFGWYQQFFTGNQQIILYQEI